MVKNGCGQSGLKNGVSMVKNVFGQSGDGTLKLTLSEEWTDGINCFFLLVDTDSQKLKVDQNFWCGHGQKWMWPVWSPISKIDCFPKME